MHVSRGRRWLAGTAVVLAACLYGGASGTSAPPLAPGFYALAPCRLVDTRGAVVIGQERTFISGRVATTVEIERLPEAVVGTPFVLNGAVRGTAAAHHQVILQASPYPYLEPFTNIGPAAVADASGRFSFRVANIATSTAFRVITVDPRPIYSPTVTVRAAVRVLLHVHPSGRAGLVRLYGTVTPAVVGAKVLFQLHKSVRSPVTGETVGKFVTQFKSVVKRASSTFSRFSIIVSVRNGGRYRALVQLPPGLSPVQSGASSTVVLRANPLATGRKKG